MFPLIYGSVQSTNHIAYIASKLFFIFQLFNGDSQTVVRIPIES